MSRRVRRDKAPTFGIDGTPEIHLLSVDPDERVIQVPAAMGLGSASLQPTCDAGSKHVDPAPDAFVGDLDAALCEEIFNVAIAEREANIHPDGTLDDVGREAVATV